MMGPHDVRLDPELAQRLARRAAALAPLGSLSSDIVMLAPEQAAALQRLAERLAGTYPYGEPHYVGQMLKPPHPLAWAAYATAMLLNPNNHALDGGPATAAMEEEAVAAIAAMFGYDEHIGHLTSSGTIANLEALWVARESHPDEVILYGENAHYTHARMCQLLGARAEQIRQDALGRLELEALETRLRAGGVGTVVATLGTTSLGAIDRIEQIAELCSRHSARLHVDAAYGGFFALLADGAQPGVLESMPGAIAFRFHSRDAHLVMGPAASAGANPHDAIGIGKFHGTITPTTPRGSRNVTSTPPPTGIWRPKRRSGAPA